MRVITLLAQKGGCGKTTLTTNLAVAAVLDRHKTLIIDLDTQKTATQWWESREDDEPSLVHTEYRELDKALNIARRKEIGLVMIDTAGRDDLLNTKAASIADFCLIPCQPTMEDMRAQATTVDLVKRQQRPAAFVLTRTGVHVTRVESARKGLAVYGLPIAPMPVVNRTAYADAYVVSQGVCEYDKGGKAAEEISQLWVWLRNKVERLAA